MIKKIVILSMAVFAIGFAGGLGIKFLYELKTFYPYSWNDDHPIILNCYGPEFSKLQMIRAIDYWTVRGHNIGFYEHDPPPAVCKLSNLQGMIIIRKARRGSLQHSTLASTSRSTIGLTIKSAEINYQPGSFNLDLINEHELGHALGYSHVDIDGHIMHPMYDKMGSLFWIP